jgi:hypothetical protein
MHWTSCAVTGFNDTSLLVASHIKPWKKLTNIERLDSWLGDDGCFGSIAVTGDITEERRRPPSPVITAVLPKL